MTEHGIECSNRDEIEDDSFTEKWIKAINDYLKKYPLNDLFKYDYILIDEGQDFKGEWVRFLKQFFTKDGEIFVVYDKAQDLYNHGLWIENSEQIKNIGFRGVPGTLKYTERLPKEIVERIQGVRNALGIKEEEILLHQNEQISFMSNCKWYNYRTNNLSDKLQQIEYVINDIQKNSRFSVALEDITSFKQ